MIKCTRCKKEFDEKENLYLPFCSKRCKQIDLGSWLTEKYAVETEDSAKPQSQHDSDDDDSASTPRKKK